MLNSPRNGMAVIAITVWICISRRLQGLINLENILISFKKLGHFPLLLIDGSYGNASQRKAESQFSWVLLISLNQRDLFYPREMEEAKGNSICRAGAL